MKWNKSNRNWTFIHNDGDTEIFIIFLWMFYMYFYQIVYHVFVECDETSAVDLIACPSPNNKGQLFCISEEFLCDKKMDCPNGEDEELVSCMFHQWVGILNNTLIEIIGFYHVVKIEFTRCWENIYNRILGEQPNDLF